MESTEILNQKFSKIRSNIQDEFLKNNIDTSLIYELIDVYFESCKANYIKGMQKSKEIYTNN